MDMECREIHPSAHGFEVRLLVVVLGLAMLAGPAMAATITAASASLADVQAAVNSASDGDTVLIPNGSVTWTGGISTSKQILIRAQNYTPTPAGMAGSGATSRSVTIQNNSGSPLFALTTGNSHHVGLAGIAFIDGGGSGAHFSVAGSGSKVALVSDLYFTLRNRFWPAQAAIVWTAQGGVLWNLYGDATSATSSTGGVGTDGVGMFVSSPRAWNTASTMGTLDTGGTVNVYIEDSTFKNMSQFPDIDDNGRLVMRYCLLDGTWGLTHGFTSTWGGRHWEYYNNTFSVTYNTSPYRNMAGRYFWCRAGTGIFTDNVVNTPVNSSQWGNVSLLNIGDNTSPGSYPQARQPGWGHNGANNVLDPIYVWSHTGGRAYTYGFQGSWGNIVQVNRELYVNNGAKPGYSKFTYPHPLRGGGPPTETPPTISGNPQSAVRLQGESVSFTVSVNGSTPLSYQWQKNQANIPGATAATYTIASVQTNDAGNYRCVVTNAYGSATSAAAALTVNIPTPVPASITAQPQSLSRTVGQSAMFTVTAAGDAPLVYQWQKNGVNVPGANAASYSIASVQTNDAGNFRCVVTNAYGSATSAVATLTVTVPLPEPASIVTHPQSLTRTVGQSATFSVVAAGTAPLTYQWQKNGLNLAGAVAASFTIASVQTNDAGSFRCLVSNAFGSATSSVATLTVNPAAAGNVRYVDFVSGNDSNPGTAASPWRRCPGMVGWSGSATLQPGDTVYFNLARTWDLGANSSGPGLDLKAGVHYIGNQWDPQGVGTGRAVLRATGRHEAGVVRFWEDHATLPTWLQGFEINANGQRANLIDINHSFWKTGLTKAVKRIEDCVAHSNSGNGSEGDYKYGIIISDNSSDASGWVANVEILNTVVFNVPRDAICLYPGNNGMISNIVVRGCEVYSTGTDPSYSEGHGLMFKGNVKNSVFEFNYAHDVNSSAVFINGPESGSGPGPSGCVARYNILQTADNNGVIRYYGTGSKSVDIIGNLVLPNEDTGGLSFSGNSGAITARIYNNTFYNSYVNLGNPTSTGTIEFRNNIIYELDDVPLTDSGSDITAHSHNLFYRANSGARAQIGGTSYTTTSITSWEPTARTADPLFKNPANLPGGFILTGSGVLVPNTDGLSLQEGSPALGVGADLGAAFSGSINGTARPAGAAWDLGAYQRVAGAAPPSPPRNLAVIP